MTLNTAIEMADRRLDNTIGVEEKLMWLKNLDRLLRETVFASHETQMPPEIEYTTDNLADELPVPSPYDEMYVFFLVMKMHLYNGEINLYNNAAEAFNTALYNFKNYWHTKHKPKPMPNFKGW